MKIKHAFLITAYRDPNSLAELMRQIASIPNSGAYLAIDSRQEKKTIDEITKSYEINEISGNKIIKIDMRWGGTSHYAAMMQLMQNALKDECTYFHTLTGQCRLICPPSVFTEFFKKNSMQNFLSYFPLPANKWSQEGGLARLKYYHANDLVNMKNFRTLRIIGRIFALLQRVIGVNRLDNIIYYGGASYYSIGAKAAQLLVGDWVKNCTRYRHTFCVEEIIPHTVLCNSDLMNLGLIKNNSLRYVNWNKKYGETPAILDADDEETLLSEAYIFARKIDSQISKGLKLPIEENLARKLLLDE